MHRAEREVLEQRAVLAEVEAMEWRQNAHAALAREVYAREALMAVVSLLIEETGERAVAASRVAREALRASS